MDNLKKKIAFVKIGGFSHINENVGKQLVLNFPDHQIDVIDVFEDIVSKKVAAAHALLEYGWDIILGRKSIIGSYMYTSYGYREIKTWMTKRCLNDNYSFTFQTQSLFDASVPGIPHFVYTDHTHLHNFKYPGFNKHDFRGKKWIALERQIYLNSSMNFTMSSNITRSIVEDYFCSPEKVRCVYCGSNIQPETDGQNQTERYSGRNILFVGIDWERKGGPVLADAFRKVLEVLPDATLSIVGCTPDVNIKNCSVYGKVPLEMIKKFYQKASVFCLPSNIEPFGIVFLEAMSFRLPVIGTNIGAMPDFILNGWNGYTVEPGDFGSLARHIADLLNEPSRCMEFGNNGFNLFRERYTWEKTGKEMTASIKQIIE